MLGTTLVAIAALGVLFAASADRSVGGAYTAFTCALLVWAWTEMSFYMGMVTGPRRTACAPGCSGWPHFGHAVLASLYHELALVAGASAIAVATWSGDNQIAIWTFVVLWWMHQSARLNVFLGVPNLNKHFLPEHLEYLGSFFRHKPMNLLFPISVTISTVCTAWLVHKAAGAESGFEATGYTLLASLMGLAVLEHWLLVLPLSAVALWNWSLSSRGSTPASTDERTPQSPISETSNRRPRGTQLANEHLTACGHLSEAPPLQAMRLSEDLSRSKGTTEPGRA
jgi:putative photosynthetic complex assembly protein 2